MTGDLEGPDRRRADPLKDMDKAVAGMLGLIQNQSVPSIEKLDRFNDTFLDILEETERINRRRGDRRRKKR